MAAPYSWTDELVTGGWLRRLSPAALRVLLAVGVHVNGSTLEAWPGIDRLRDLTGDSESTVRAALAELREVGLIDVATRTKPGKFRAYEVTVYTFRAFPPPPQEYPSGNSDHTSPPEYPSENLGRSPFPPPLQSLPPELSSSELASSETPARETEMGTGNGQQSRKLDRPYDDGELRGIVREALASRNHAATPAETARVFSRMLQHEGYLVSEMMILEELRHFGGGVT